MIHDRQYMRDYQPGGPAASTVVIVTLIVAYVLQVGATLFFRADPTPYLGLSWDGLRHWRLWQPVTYMFLHGMPNPLPLHVLFNCFAIYAFGRHLEEFFGRKVFLFLLFGGALAGAAVQILSVTFPMHRDLPVVGASAGVMCLLAAYATLFPHNVITTFISFFPVQIKAIWLLYLVGGLTVFLTIFPVDPYTAHPAHLGGLALGVAAVKMGWLSEFGAPDIGEWFRSLLPQRKQAKGSGVPAWQAEIMKRQEPAPESEFMAREVDPILEKISTHGMQSLTAKERQILEAARKKMAKR